MKLKDAVMAVSKPEFKVTLIDRTESGYSYHSFFTMIEARKFALTHVLDFVQMTVDGQCIYTNISITEEGRAVLSFNY